MSKHTWSQSTEEYGFRALLVFLLLYIFGSPFLTPYPSLAVIAHSSLSLTLLFSVYTVQKQQRYRSMAMILLLPVLGLYWLGIHNVLSFSRPVSYLLMAIYYLLLICSYASQIVRYRRITTNVIFATLCLYLIIGLFWGSLYSFLYEINPNAYAGSLLENTQGNKVVIFNYFSMITLTTLGYGDITPQTPGAGALCQIEAIIGQFFTAVLIAWFVGNYVSDKKKAE